LSPPPPRLPVPAMTACRGGDSRAHPLSSFQGVLLVVQRVAEARMVWNADAESRVFAG
jgi:hypothetical protein